MTCKAGAVLLRKVAVPTVVAIALMFSTTQSARPQASQAQITGMTIQFLPDGNQYTCDLNVVFTPSFVANFHCQATLTVGSPVDHAVKSQAAATLEIETPFGPGELFIPVNVEERPDGTANVYAHN